VTIPCGTLGRLCGFELFAHAYSHGAGITIRNYDIARDGRFVMVRDDARIARLRVILNWHADAAACTPSK
jgi:hypothetical protein